MQVPFIDLKRDTAEYYTEYLECTKRVLDSGSYSLGPEVEAFERLFAEYLGVKHVIGVNGGTWALYAACMALGIGPGDEVIVPANSFIATAEAVVLCGAKAVFCDVRSNDLLMDLATCDALVTPHTKAIIPVHLYGKMVDMDQVMTWAGARGLRVIEDAAQSHGATRAGRKTGSIGDLGCFSFYPTKNLGALGEGGAIATQDDELAHRIRGIRLHGILKDKYRHDIFGTNLKMEALQGAYLQSKLSRLDQKNVTRRKIAERYRLAWQDLPIDLPPEASEDHVYHLYVIRTDQRDALQTFLKEQGIASGIHYPGAIPDQPVFQTLGASGQWSVAQKEAGRLLSLPLFPEMRDEEVEYVIQQVRAFFHR